MGQEEYLVGAELIFVPEYQPFSDKWEHEHCEFCFEKISSADGDLHFGYCTNQRKNWICPTCFEDFKDEFKWTIASSNSIKPNFPDERND